MVEAKLKERFFLDSASFLTEVTELLSGYSSRINHQEYINSLFRILHSLKSEAAYCGYKVIEKEAHTLESMLEQRRLGKVALSPKDIEAIRSGITTISKERKRLLMVKNQTLKNSQIKRKHQKSSDKAVQSIFNDNAPVFNAFEKELLFETFERGEAFYRINIEIEPSAPLKYPKAYLVVNNLELEVNVVKVTPDFSLKDQDDLFSHVAIYFTTEKDVRAIYQFLRIDQLKRIELTSLDYKTFLPYRDQKGDNLEESGEPFPIRVSSLKLDELHSYIDEMKIRLYSCRTGMARHFKGVTNPFVTEITQMDRLISGIESSVQEMRMVKLIEGFSRYEGVVKEISETLSKEISIKMHCEAVEIDRRVFELLDDALVQLIRNACVHGIESADTRTHLGKNSQGTIRISSRKDGNFLRIDISDDGRGIDQDSIYKRAKNLGILREGDPHPPLLEVLTAPGFSTIDEVDEVSGRGVGLDLALQKIQGITDSRFEVVTEEGKGTTFSIFLPGDYLIMDILLIRSQEMTIAIPGRHILSIVEANERMITRDENGKLFYDKLPLYSVNGRVAMSEGIPEEQTIIRLSYIGTQACLLAEDILFRDSIPENQLTLRDEGTPHLFSVFLNARRMEYLYLNPALIEQ